MIPEEIEFNRQVEIHKILMREITFYVDFMKGRETAMIENKVAM